ncbi:MAG: ribbon-helix-helix protein, CopG family [Candidatus Angelobacter sp.]
MPMKRSHATLRINPEQLEALKNISKAEGRAVNELLREAIRHYLSRRNLNNLAGPTSALRTDRKQNLGFKNAIKEFVDAEARFEDPLEGELIESQSGAWRSGGPVQRKIRDILDS